MFASSMKISTTNTNNTSPTALQSGGGTQSVTSVLNSSGNIGDEGGKTISNTTSNHKLNKRDQKHIKSKFVHGNTSKMQQHIAQQQQHTQKYHQKNNNGSRLKNHNYNNNCNNNTTSSLNRKKYYQQQQHHQQHQHYEQQQQYLTTIQKNTNSLQATTTITNNNNSNLVKNQNFSNIDSHSQQQQHQHSSVVKNLVNQNTNLIETSTGLLQHNCDKLSLSSRSSGCSSSPALTLTTTSGDYHCQHQQSHTTICYDKNIKSFLISNPQSSLLNETHAKALATSACNTCWSNFTKLPQQLQSEALSNLKSAKSSNNLEEFVTNALVAAAASKCDVRQNLTRTAPSSHTSSTILLTSSGGQLHLPLNTLTSASATKKKLWKNTNTSSEIEIAVEEEGSCSSTTAVSTSQSPKLSKEKKHHGSDKNLNTNTSKHLGKNTNLNSNEQNYTTKSASNVGTNQQPLISKHHILAAKKLAMTTSLTASSGSTSIKTSVSSNNTSTTLSSFKTSTISPKPQQDKLEKLNDSKHLLKNLSNHTQGNSDINKTTTISSSPTPTPPSSVTSSQNSYTLDFLHSVGVKMTGVALRSSGIQGPTNSYSNQSITGSPVHSTYTYTGMSTNQRQPRYMYGGSNANNSNNKNQLPHYHHHQPSQLTIASFLHKDLLGGDNVNSNSNSNNTSGGASPSSNPRNTNNYNDQQQQPYYTKQHPQTHTRFHNNYSTNPYQQQSTVMQHINYSGGGEFSSSVASGSGGGQRSSGYAYTNSHNAAAEGGMSKNNMTQLHSKQLKNNMVNSKNLVSNSPANKKLNYVSSTTSTCSSSSTKSITSSSSNISSRQPQTTATQECNNNSSNLNLAIETLPTKMLSGVNQRGSHRTYHHNNHGHHHANHQHPHLMMNSPNVIQHQNYYNLTYVTTDGSSSGATSRGCSPAPQSLPPSPISATNFNSPKSLENSPRHLSMLINFNASNLQYPRYQHAQHLATQQQQQFHQFQQQQQTNLLNKKLIVPLSLNMPSPSPSPTLASNSNLALISQQAPAHNFICCSQLDEATTAAAAAAAISSTSSGIIAGNDYDSDASSNHSSTQIKYQSVKSTKASSSSSSSSASSTSMMAQQSQQRVCLHPATAPTTPLHSPSDYNYSGVTPQIFPNGQAPQQAQLPQFYGNNSGAVALLNFPTKPPNALTDEDYQQQYQFYFNATANQRPPEHLNLASAITAYSNRSNNSSGYWSPSFQNNQFLYHQLSSAQAALVPPITSSSSSCGSSSASISPRLPNDDLLPQIQQRLQKCNGVADASLSPSSCTSSLNEQLSNIIVGNTLNVDVEKSRSSSSVTCYSNESNNTTNSTNGDHNFKRSSSQLMIQQKQRLISQQTCQSSSSSTSSLSNSSASTLTTAVRARGGVGGESGMHNNNGSNSQFPPFQTSVTSLGGSVSGSQHLSPTSTQHFYSHHQSLPPALPPHNMLYNNPHTHHMRALSSSSINSSVHDFFSHTPPDRFLARAHLIEAKEEPATLLNNSKWDHLSHDIWKKFTSSQQTEETFKQKMLLWRYLYVFIKNAYPRYGLYLVGSTISGFGSDSSDVDMCLVSRNVSSIDPRMEALFNLTVLRDCLSKSGQFENFNLIEAKVPILRFCDRMHQLEVDLNFNNCVGIKNTHLLYCYSQLDWRLRPLVLVTKLWAQYHNINNAKNMTISSYSLVLMVIHFLQYAVNPPVLPCLHDIFPDKFPLLRSNDFGYVDMNETIGPYDSKNTQTIGELFLLFLQYYSFFDYTQFAISVRTGGLLPINICRTAKSLKNDIHQWKELCIEEPFDLTNTARSVYDFETFERVKAVFLGSWRVLQESLDLNSVFSTVSIASACSAESSNVLHHISSTINTATCYEIGASVDANATKISLEQYVKDFNIPTTASENLEDYSRSSIENDEEGALSLDGNNTDEGDINVTAINSSLIITSARRKLPKRKDLNRTLTPRRMKIFGEKELSFPPLPSTFTTLKTSTKNVNGNNNNNVTPSSMSS